MTARSALPQQVRLTNLLCRACGVTCTPNRWPKLSRPSATRLLEQQPPDGAKAAAEATRLTVTTFKLLPEDRQFHRPSHVDEVFPNSRLNCLRAQDPCEVGQAAPHGFFEPSASAACSSTLEVAVLPE